MGKKDGGLRMCIDYRGRSDITVKKQYPLTLISFTYEFLQGSNIYTKLNLPNSYHLVHIREGDEWKTAFSTTCEHYEDYIQPFSLTNAPAVFQDPVNDVLGDKLNQFVFVCLDDILIFPDLCQSMATLPVELAFCFVLFVLQLYCRPLHQLTSTKSTFS